MWMGNVCLILVEGMVVRAFVINFNRFMMLPYSEKIVNQARKTRGYLHKKSSGLLSIWQKRYFIIIDETLAYYPDETLEQARKMIKMEQIKYIKAIDSNELQLVTKKRIYELRAEDEATRDFWIASLNILINYQEWDRSPAQKTSRTSSKKQIISKRTSKNKKMTSRTLSPPSLSKYTSFLKRKDQEEQFQPERFWMIVGLSKLAQRWKQQCIRNKVILLKEQKGCYFIISCKTLLRSHCDEDLLNAQLIYPYDFNCLYYFQFGRVQNLQVAQVCKCSVIKEVEQDNGKIKLTLSNRVIYIKPEHRRMQIFNADSIVRKIRHAGQIDKQFHNQLGIKIKRNIDSLIFKFQAKETKINQLVHRQIQNCIIQNKDFVVKHQFRKNMDNLKKNIKEIIGCCDVKNPVPKDFKEEFVKEFCEAAYVYWQRMWTNQNKSMTLQQLKKMLLLLFDFGKIVKSQVKDDRFYCASRATQKVLISKYQQEIMSKIDSCFSLSEKQILDQVKIEMKGQENISQMQTLFLSNKIFRHFHLDVRFVLYQFPEMPIHQQFLQDYLTLFYNIFKHISQKTFKVLDQWKDINLILGTCNEIECIKNSLFEEMLERLSKDYKHLTQKLQKQNVRELEGQMSCIEIMLVKKLFVLTFSNIDRNLLNKTYDQLNIALICQQIIYKLKAFTRINKYVKRNIFQASFQQICYFYYTSMIKFINSKDKQLTSEFFTKKIGEDIKSLGQYFEMHISNDKIYTHLKDLSLLKEFLHCDFTQIKKICQSLKKQFGNSFNEVAVKNLFNLREMNQQLRQNMINECSQIVKNSAQTPEQISFVSSSRESFFLQNWNNTRSRKSTLTLSLNQFYQNQQSIHQNKYNCSKLKQGFLLKKKISKNSSPSQTRNFFKIANGQLIEYESSNDETPLNVYQMQFVKKCYLHPDKNYIFIIEMAEVKLQFKADSTDQAKEWIRNIYEEISSLSMLLKQKDKPSQSICNSVQKEPKEISTMQSFPKLMKDRSLEKSGGVSSPKKGKREQSKGGSQIVEELSSPKRQRMQPQDNCLKCSKGFFF